MHKLWVANVEEALPSDDLLFDHYYTEKSAGMFSRFLTELHPGDMLLVPFRLSEDYCNYMDRLMGLGDSNVYIVNAGLSASRLLVDATLECEHAMQTLRKYCHPGEWYIESFIETSNILRLARELNLPTRGTAPELIESGLINDLNDKLHFKYLAMEAGVSVVPGKSANNAIDLAAHLRNWGKRFQRIMLRKTKYAGGAGNLSGHARMLLPKIKDWYNKGTVMVEPFLNITQVAGSLVHISDDQIDFLGVDRQVFEHGGWCGFTYPFVTPGSEHLYSDFNIEAVKEGALKLAKVAQMRGARGFMNIDWAFISGQHDKPIALECNFRHNGFGYVVEFAKSYFGESWRKQTVYCRESIPCGLPSFERLCLKLRELTLYGEKVFIDGTGAQRGMIITNPPRDGKISIAIFGPDQRYISDVWKLVEPVIETGKYY